MKLNKRTGRFFKEVWRDVVGYEGLYQVSNLGRVKSLDRVDSNGRKLKGKILKPRKENAGYLLIALYKNGIKKDKSIHRLVAETFISNPEGKGQVDHINTVRTDNRVQNLRWTTHKENNNNPLTKQHYSESKKGKNNPKATKVICITTGEVFDTIEEAGEYYNCNKGNISTCCNGKRKSAGKLPDGTKLVWKYL